MLKLQEDGTITEISEAYFDSSRCAYLEAYEDASAVSQNLTLTDLAGVFMVLGIFVALSLVVWTFRRSPPAKKGWSAYHEQQEKKKSLQV